ncbi:MAG: hypothetical protein DK303_001008 [Chloroflexi bacterium]|nr:MAG: hypothetical protein DK303_001008 [Chloroflexota bacterium]
MVLDPGEAELSEEEDFVSVSDFGSFDEEEFASEPDSLVVPWVSEELVFLVEELPFFP